MMSSPCVRVALVGDNGHQLQHVLLNHPLARVVGIYDISKEKLPKELQEVKHYSSFDELIKDRKQIDLISFCSRRRRDQAKEVLIALQNGFHVYAEKPVAMDEETLDLIVSTAQEHRRVFHEMAGTVWEQPYYTMREIAQSGILGRIVQVFVQKSYPFHENRPQDEDIDGGLTLQVGVHAFRLVEHITGIRIVDVECWETTLGNPVEGGGLRMANSMILKLHNGGVASVICNYLNPRGFQKWGNESVRIFGEKGMIEAVDAGQRRRLIIGDQDYGSFDLNGPSIAYHDWVFAEIIGIKPFPISLEEELHPTRMIIRAKQKAKLIY